MATAIVTGSSSGIGEACSRMLLDEGYKVIGISRSKGPIENPKFHHIACDLRDSNAIEAIKNELQSIKDLILLVNSAGFGRFEPHEELSPTTITDMIALNLTAPILLTNLLLRSLKGQQGHIINITSIEATRSSKFAALYTATKTGLRAFGNSLFEELRTSGVGVITINPDMTDTPFFNDLRFGVGEDETSKLLANDIATLIKETISQRSGVAITEVTVRSQRFGIIKKK